MSRYSPSPEDHRRHVRSPMRDRFRGRGSPPPRGRRRGSSQDRYSGCLFIGNIPYHFREKHIRDIFHKSGAIENITIGLNRATGQPKGHAFVQYCNYRDAQDAHYRFQGYRIDGRPLHIDYDAGMRQKLRSYGPRRPYTPYDRFPRRRHSRSSSRSLSPSPSGRRFSKPRRSTSRSPRGASRSPHHYRHGSRSPGAPRGSPGRRSPSKRESPPPPNNAAEPATVVVQNSSPPPPVTQYSSPPGGSSPRITEATSE